VVHVLPPADLAHLPTSVKRFRCEVNRTFPTVIAETRKPPDRGGSKVIGEGKFSPVVGSVSRTRGSDRPVQRTGGETGRLVYQSLNGETPLGSGESTRTPRDCVNFRNASETRCR
jgi:hypothetical protein